ncbi:MAG TPA: hypothetical protein VNA89_01490 [Gemmatimonadaceae bacterium]|nr:hypothetical protein [Gemmatimonadaceae bacterium]
MATLELAVLSRAERVVVHCLAGVSRSPGVALGLCDLRGWATAALEGAHPAWNRPQHRSASLLHVKDEGG